MKLTNVCPSISVLARQSTDGDRILAASELDNLLNLRFKLGCRDFTAILVGEWNLEEFVLSNKYDVIMRCSVEFLGCVRGFGRVSGGMESGTVALSKFQHGFVEEKHSQPFVRMHRKGCTSNLLGL